MFNHLIAFVGLGLEQKLVDDGGGISLLAQAGYGLATGRFRGGDINGLGQTESEATSFFETNHGRGLLVLRSFDLRNFRFARVAANEEAGRLNWQSQAYEVDRIKSQANITAIALEVGGADALHASYDRGATGDHLVPFNDNRLVDNRLEGAVGARVLGG
jgi:hypothetical protein